MRALVMQNPWSVELPTRAATRRLARQLAPHLAEGDLVILAGPLGSGKTFFARALCRALGVPRDQRVTSPTFALVHELSGRLRIAHADLYRLEHARDLDQLGLADLRDLGFLLLVEWGEPYVRALGGDALLVRLSLEPRQATFTATGARSRGILALGVADSPDPGGP